MNASLQVVLDDAGEFLVRSVFGADQVDEAVDGCHGELVDASVARPERVGLRHAGQI